MEIKSQKSMTPVRGVSVGGWFGLCGGCDSGGISMALGIQVSRGVKLILLAPLCNIQTHPAFTDQLPPAFKMTTQG